MRDEFYIEELEKYINKLEKHSHKSIINLSDWNPSSEFMNKLAINIPYTFSDNPISYIFSSDFDKKMGYNVLSKWGYTGRRKIVFFNTGSESIVNTLYFLSHQKCKKIYLLCPTYFSVAPICKALSLDCHRIFMDRKNKKYVIPDDFEERIDENCCLWITNPIYCTGTMYQNTDIEKIKEIVFRKNLFIVTDESLCIRKFSLFKHFEEYDRYINIITPHKAVCTNALKFSGIVISPHYYDLVDSCSDLLEGCLSVSAKAALYHFLSPKFDIYENSFNKYIEENRKKVLSIISKYKIDCDMYSKGYLLSVYFRNIPYDFLDSMARMKKLIAHTNTYVITGSKNSFGTNEGLSFRINLCSVNNKYIYAFERTLLYLQKLL